MLNFLRRISLTKWIVIAMIAGIFVGWAFPAETHPDLARNLKVVSNMQTQRALSTPAENFTVLRVRRNLFGTSDIGVLLQNRAATDSNTWNRSVGVDANLRFRSNTIVSGYAARSAAPV